jgi:hypothetical protein
MQRFPAPFRQITIVGGLNSKDNSGLSEWYDVGKKNLFHMVVTNVRKKTSMRFFRGLTVPVSDVDQVLSTIRGQGLSQGNQWSFKYRHPGRLDELDGLRVQVFDVVNGVLTRVDEVLVKIGGCIRQMFSDLQAQTEAGCEPAGAYRRTASLSAQKR